MADTPTKARHDFERKSGSTDGPTITVTREAAVDATARIDLDGRPPSEIHQALTDHHDFQAALVAAIRDVLEGRTPAEAREFLRDAGVTALDGLYADLCVKTALGAEYVTAGDDRHPKSVAWRFLQVTRALGAGQTPVDLRSREEDRLASFTPILAHADRTPTVDVRIREGFRNQRADHRRTIVGYLNELARGCDVRLVAGPIARRFLRAKHGDGLPVSVENQCNPHRNSHPTADVVEDALAELDPDSQTVTILRDVVESESGAVPYSALYSRYPGHSESTIRGYVGTLYDLGLIDKYERPNGKHVEPLPAAIQFVDRLDAEIGRQRQLEGYVDETPKQPPHRRVTQRERGRGGEGTAADGDRYRVRYLPRRDHHAAAASAPENGIAAVERSIDPHDRPGDAGVSYDHRREELVISTDLTSPLQYTVCIARALTDGRVRTTALTESDLDDLLADADRGLLRDARQLGWLSSDIEDGADYWDALVEARESLLDLTHDLHNADGDEDRASLCREILRLASGLAGVVVHALDRLGIDVVREVRLSRYAREDTDTRDDLAETLAHAVEVQSRYGEFAAFRQLLEDRERKRTTAMSPRVDAADPSGSFIGSMTIVGRQAEDLAARLHDRLEGAEYHDDAPEFAVPYPIDTDPGRRATADAVERVCATKDLRPTRTAVSMLDAVTGSPYAAAAAIHALDTAEYPREIRLDEVRYALASVPSDRILPTTSPGIQAIVSTLLRSDAPLSQATLADRADVTQQTIRNHAETLAALDLVRETEGGYRVALPSKDEFGEEICPEAAADPFCAAHHVLGKVSRAALDDDRRRELTAIPDIGDRLRAYADTPATAPWVPVATALAFATAEADPPPRNVTTAEVGPPVAQTAVHTATAGGRA